MRRVPLCACLLLLAAAPLRAEWYSDARQKMGTKVEIQLWADSEAAARPLLAAGMAEFDRIESWMSTYREDSEISRVNRLAAREPVKVSAELFGIVQKSLELSVLSDGAFDITFDSVGKLYDFRAGVRPDADCDPEEPPGHQLPPRAPRPGRLDHPLHAGGDPDQPGRHRQGLLLRPGGGPPAQGRRAARDG